MARLAKIIKENKGKEEKAPLPKKSPEEISPFKKLAAQGKSASLLKGMADSDIVRCEQLYENTLDFVKKVMSREEVFDVNEAREIILRMMELLNNKKTSDILLGLALTRDSMEENYLYSHSVNVTIISLRLAKVLGYDKFEQSNLGLAGLLHDIGMQKMPGEIKNKSGHLNHEELDVIATHPSKSYEWLKKVKNIEEAIYHVVYQHHEKVNGKGYPQGLTNGQIHKDARIIGLVDAYEARIHRRAWRKAILPDEAVSDILDKEKEAYEPELIKILLKEVSIYPLGSWVRLNTKEIAKVVNINPGAPLRPVVEVVFDAEGKKSKKPKLLNLFEQPLIYVKESCEGQEQKR